MKANILFLERRSDTPSYSLERVFRQIAKSLSTEEFAVSFQNMPYMASTAGVLKNLIRFRRQDADIYHITGDIHYISLLLPAAKTILTIHDLQILRVRKGLRRYLIKKLFFDLPVRRVKYLTAISEQTKAEIIAQTGCQADKVRVIENPLDERFVAENKPEFNSTRPNILQVGTAPHKNLSNLILAVEGLDCRLTIVGELDGETRKLLQQKQIEYTNLVDLDHDGIRQQYLHADIVAFCSLFEGFGLPIIEAQAMRTPVLTSGHDPMGSVAGDGAYLCDPNDPLSIREGVLALIGDRETRERLVLDGLENVKRFSADRITAKYEELYREVLAGS